MRGLRIVSVVLCLWAALAPTRVLADPETDAYHAAVAGAYRHYREAVHYFENDNPDLGALALEEFQAAWRPIIRQYGDTPPPAYRSRPLDEFNRSLHEILNFAQKAHEALNYPSERSARLGAIGMILYSMRQANNVHIYSDCIRAMNLAMARLWAYRQEPPSPDKPESVARYKVRVQETARQYRQCRDEAPAAYRDTEEFRRLFDGALASLAKLEAVDIAHTDALSSLLRELHSFDRLIWLRFG